MIQPESDNYLDIFLHDKPLMDVRAPVEFAKGAFPMSTIIPLLDDDQRAAIGTKYQELGQKAALDLGWQLLTPDLKRERQARWLAFISANPEGYLYCFRGGLRSKITQQLIAEAGCQYPRVVGGYKAMRRFLIDSLERLGETVDLLIVAGRTCSGKTQVIENSADAIDLERLARHRGSAFGRYLQDQPTQIDFENALAIALLKHRHLSNQALVLEDEGKLIGRCALPLGLKSNMSHANRVVVHAQLEERVSIAVKDYVTDKLSEFQALFGEAEGLKQYANYWMNSLSRIQKRLGGDRYAAVHSLSEDAVELLQQGGAEGFVPVIHCLLVNYYDPMYDYQSASNEGTIVFQGDLVAVQEWIRENAVIHSAKSLDVIEA